jgi:hypothetical protein
MSGLGSSGISSIFHPYQPGRVAGGCIAEGMDQERGNVPQDHEEYGGIANHAIAPHPHRQAEPRAFAGAH